MKLINLILSLSIANSNHVNKVTNFNLSDRYNNFLIKSIENNLDIIKTENVKFSDIHPYEFDCVWSLGMHCRPAHYIQLYGLRFQAAPFDWMDKTSLKEIINQKKTNFENFFSEIEDITPKNSKLDHRMIKDKKGKTVAMHHFPKNISPEKYKKTFRDMMIKRANKVDKIMKNSKSVGFIREDESNNLSDVIDFGKQISQMYKNLDNIVIFYIINSKDENLKNATKTTFDNVTIISVKLNDVPLDKNGKEYKSWKGNPNKWKNYVMKFISPSEKLKRDIVEASLNKVVKT